MFLAMTPPAGTVPGGTDPGGTVPGGTDPGGTDAVPAAAARAGTVLSGAGTSRDPLVSCRGAPLDSPFISPPRYMSVCCYPPPACRLISWEADGC
ncbi:hypothetical protein GCM10018980_01940 [Streptomyces capoamus]|uniref:Uncharacterized protein n=1 Tax=Streptomyces capoamus TaxID=68183 RepID=A0A919C197_9ACTN|nr:hypothetical protein GCM10010501_09950 [Streptomyces libani subsp. rufus]GHG33325.1 hypothetical protein GCM10018980_01940 [Streptomyces capoamus]